MEASSVSDGNQDRLSLDDFATMVLQTGMLLGNGNVMRVEDAYDTELDSLSLVELLAIIDEQGVKIDEVVASDLTAIRTLRDAHLFYLTQGQMPSTQDHGHLKDSDIPRLDGSSQ